MKNSLEFGIESLLETCKFSKPEIELVINNLQILAVDSVENFLFSMGDDARHRYENTKDLFHHFRFGFERIRFNSSGWLMPPIWLNPEVFNFGPTSDPDMVKIKVAMGKNGRWVSAQDIQYGGSGSGEYCGYSIYNKPYPDKQSAFDSSYAYCIERLNNAIEKQESLSYKDTTNFNVPHMKSTVKKMKEYVESKKQLSLF